MLYTVNITETMEFSDDFKRNSSYWRKMKFSINDFFSQCDQIRSFLWNWSHLLKKSLMENLIFCAVYQKGNFERIFNHVYFEDYF